LNWYRDRRPVLQIAEPEPVDPFLAAADAAGIDRDALVQGLQRVQRRRDGVRCLTLPGSFAGKRYIAVSGRDAA
jgi:hypothetical protein